MGRTPEPGARSGNASAQQASQQLDLRCGEITRQLAGLGLTCRRLEHRDLVRLLYASLHQRRALSRPLHAEWIEAVGHMHQPRLQQWLTFDEVLEQEPTIYASKNQTVDEPWRLTPQWANLFAPANIRLTPEHLIIEESEWTQTITYSTMFFFYQLPMRTCTLP